jgi:hypothetical protein
MSIQQSSHSTPLCLDSLSSIECYAADFIDPELSRLLRDQVAALGAQYRDEFPQTVLSILRTGLLTDHASEGQVAKLLSMHSRTLHQIPS